MWVWIFWYVVGAVKAIRSMRLWAYETFKLYEVLYLVCMVMLDDLVVNVECVWCECCVIGVYFVIVGGEFVFEVFSRFDEIDRFGW